MQASDPQLYTETYAQERSFASELRAVALTAVFVISYSAIYKISETPDCYVCSPGNTVAMMLIWFTGTIFCEFACKASPCDIPMIPSQFGVKKLSRIDEHRREGQERTSRDLNSPERLALRTGATCHRRSTLSACDPLLPESSCDGPTSLRTTPFAWEKQKGLSGDLPWASSNYLW